MVLNVNADFALQEKEKETKRLPLVSSTPWSLLLLSLSHLALAEKAYFSLPFIAKKFFRKDVCLNYCKIFLWWSFIIIILTLLHLKSLLLL